MKLEKPTEDVLIMITENIFPDDLTGSVINIKSQLLHTPDVEIARAFCYMQLEIDKLTKERNILKIKADLRSLARTGMIQPVPK
jgi:hypothetical protein